MSAIEEAEALRQQAIKLLLAEQESVKDKLLQLGHGQDNMSVGRRRGRRPKAGAESAVTSNAAGASAGAGEGSRPSEAGAGAPKS